MAWQQIDGMFCAGGPVDGCGFCMLDGRFGAPGLILVRLSATATEHTIALSDSGFVVGLECVLRSFAANSARED